VLFINGALDEYTTTQDVQLLARYVENCEFAVVPNAGHFLDLESTETRRITGEVKRKFLFSDQVLPENVSATAPIDLEMAM
jgi:rhamnosyltransferase subunit A